MLFDKTMGCSDEAALVFPTDFSGKGSAPKNGVKCQYLYSQNTVLKGFKIHHLVKLI